MAHLLTVTLTIVRQHVHEDQESAGREHARHFRQRALGLRHVVQDQHQRGRIKPRIVDGK